VNERKPRFHAIVAALAVSGALAASGSLMAQDTGSSTLPFAESVAEPATQANDQVQAADEAAPLYFVDATHPSHTGRPAHGWIRRGRTVELKSNHGRTRININGALWGAVVAGSLDRPPRGRTDHQCGDDPAP